jgi:hypothetical protein
MIHDSGNGGLRMRALSQDIAAVALGHDSAVQQNVRICKPWDVKFLD